MAGGAARRSAPRLAGGLVDRRACAFTLPAWRHLLDGPATATVDVQAIECTLHRRRSGPFGPCILDELRLGDGRRLIAEPDALRGLRAPLRARLVALDDVALSLQPE